MLRIVIGLVLSFTSTIGALVVNVAVLVGVLWYHRVPSDLAG